MADKHELEKYIDSFDEQTAETGFVSEVITEDMISVNGIIKSDAKLPKDIDLCIVKTIDVSEGMIKATGTNIKYSDFSVEIPNLS